MIHFTKAQLKEQESLLAMDDGLAAANRLITVQDAQAHTGTHMGPFWANVHRNGLRTGRGTDVIET